ncbi:hypothetical protein [Vibrio harveyi]|uniref:hypothetical protein n=1 Tax=Vibrio harveyi TaxID=669 RepID=UPI003345C8F9|nr:hypothetical protein [Vibrio harveyi]
MGNWGKGSYSEKHDHGITQTTDPENGRVITTAPQSDGSTYQVVNYESSSGNGKDTVIVDKDGHQTWHPDGTYNDHR